jgi:DNA topoisomerase I
MALSELIIVESPTKARTIGQYLGKGYKVLSSQGHVRDLPKNDLGVEIDKGFTPRFETKRNKRVKELREAAKGAKRVYLATDHDREGEAIAYDLYTILKQVVKDNEAFSRPIFNEITKSVILKALESPEKIDLNKVEAQRTRRILDRLVGYQVSPLLSRVVAGNRFEGLSAGRVQSVALRLLCDREAEISRFVPEEYWEIDAHLRDDEPFVARLTRRDGEKFVIHNEQEAQGVTADLEAARVVVESLSEKERRRQPSPPFITSSLQQTASSALHFSPKRTMKIAQELYEGVSLPEGDVGLITYMRTDSVRMSPEALESGRAVIKERFGKSYLSPKPRQYKNKKRSQDAHEAIRPTDPARSPEAVARHLSPDQNKLYTLIYNRFLATQMVPAVYKQRKAVLTAGPYTLEAAGSTLMFDGYLRLFPDDGTRDAPFPPGLREGEAVTLERVEPRQKFTEPPRRYSEAGLVNLLEKEGVGRPSTYASIVSVIQERRYTTKRNGSLRPTLLGQVVVEFLKDYFQETVETQFTAHMEEDLDRIEEGDLSREDALREFYEPFSKRLAQLEATIGDSEARAFRVLTDVDCPVCGAPMELRYWKGSHFLGCSRYPECRNTRSLPPEFPYRYEGGRLLLREGLEEMEREARENAVACPVCGGMMELRNGRYGRYYRCTNPDCGKTMPVSTGVPCPSCGEGTLVEKYSARKHRTFYSCNRYPACRFAVSDRPVKLCPVCEEGVLVEKSRKLRCSNKDCGHTEPLPDAPATDDGD